jgi:hypothetical protein
VRQPSRAAPKIDQQLTPGRLLAAKYQEIRVELVYHQHEAHPQAAAGECRPIEVVLQTPAQLAWMQPIAALTSLFV